MWYVIQVRTGKEEEIQLQCEKVIREEVLERCFIPRYEQMKRYQGKWHKEKKILFPGYVFLVSEDEEHLHFELKKVIGLTKLIGTGDEIVVGVSKGMIVDDKVIIQTGPLKGNEGLIKKIDRHKRKAWLELELFGRTVETQVGLEIVEKR